MCVCQYVCHCLPATKESLAGFFSTSQVKHDGTNLREEPPPLSAGGSVSLVRLLEAGRPPLGEREEG